MDNLPSRNPEHAVDWPRTVQTGLSILGASAVGIACFFGGGDLIMVGGGSPDPSTQPSAPATPTHDAVSFASTNDSLRIIGSVYQGNPETDTHDSTQVAVDTAGAAIDADSGFVTPRYFASLGAVTTDTVPALDPGGVFVSRIRYKGAQGGWSAWSDSLSTTMTTVNVLFQCDWDDVGDRDKVQSCGTGAAYSFNTMVTTNDTAIQVVDASDAGLDTNWPNDRAYLVRCQGRSDGCARQVVRNLGQWDNAVAGDTIALRLTRTVAVDVMKGTGDMDEHGWKPSPAGGSNGTAYFHGMKLYVADSTWTPRVRPLNGASWPDWRWCAIAVGGTGGCNGSDEVHIPAGKAYEYHIKVWFPTDTSYAMDTKVYDVSGDSLVNWVWQNQNGSDTMPTEVFIADTTTSRGWNWNQITLGHSATNEFTFGGTGEPLFYFGGYAICKNNSNDDGWCPRYGGLPGEN